jgi:carboxylesterase
VSARIKPGAEPFRFDAGPIGALLQHGFTGSPASMRPMGQWLSEHGISSVGPRLPGHGTTWEDLEGTTWQDWERESESALTDLASRCSPVIAVGLSMGGAMVIHLAAKHPDLVKGVVTINGDIHRPELAAAPLLRLISRSRKGVVNDIKKPGQDEVGYDRIPVRTLSQLSRLYKTAEAELPSVRAPLLVFSSSEDHVVRPANSRLIHDKAGSLSKQFVPLANSYHVATLDFDAELIGSKILEFANAVASGAGAPA